MVSRNLNLVIDTQIFIYALSDEHESACVKLFDLIENNKVNVLFAQDTFGELIYMLKHWSRHNIIKKQDRLDLLHNFVDLFYNSLSLNTYGIECPKIVDNSDEMFVKCAIKGNADFLITDDILSGMHNNEELKKLGVNVIKSTGFIKIYEQENKVVV